MHNLDILQRFLFTDIPARGLLVRLDNAYQSALRRHPYPQSIGPLLGKTLAATTLLCATIKFEGKLTLQTQTDGPINLLVAQSDELLNIRGLAKWHGDIHDGLREQDLLGKGHIGITIAPKVGERYQGIVAIDHQTLAQVLENYFMQSEQLPTAFVLTANEHRAAGILLQVIPDAQQDTNRSYWSELITQLKQMDIQQLLSEASNEELISHIFPQHSIQLLNNSPVEFRCDCNVERMERAIRVIGRAEADELLRTHRVVTVTCEFCHHQYDFDEQHVAQIFAKDADDSDSSVIVTH